MARRSLEGKSGSGRVRRLSATELAKGLSDVLSRVHYRNETVIIERGGRPLCQLSPISGSLDFRLTDLLALLESLPSASDPWKEAVARGVADQEEFEGFEWPRCAMR